MIVDHGYWIKLDQNEREPIDAMYGTSYLLAVVQRDLRSGSSVFGARLFLVVFLAEAIGPTDLDDAGREPALVAGRQPFCRVVIVFLAAVHVRADEGEVAKVPGAQPRIMGLARRHHVFDVRLGRARKASTSVGAMDRAQAAHDLPLNGLRVAVVSAAVVGRAAMLGRHGQAAPCLGSAGPGKRQRGDRREDARRDGVADGYGAGYGGSVSPARSARRLSAMRAADAFTESRARWA